MMVIRIFKIAPMLSSLILDSNRKVTNWISTRISCAKIKPFDTGLEPTMSTLVNGRVKLTTLLLTLFSSLYSNFILNLYIVYELNAWPRNPANNFTLKIVYLVQST